MAIAIRGATTCSLCDAVLSPDDDIVLFPHFIAEADHPLWQFSDSAMHRDCFRSWPEASRFREAFNRLWRSLVPDRPRRMTEDGSIVDC